jgi:tRNA(Ile)-lysidine synthase
MLPLVRSKTWIPAIAGMTMMGVETRMDMAAAIPRFVCDTLALTTLPPTFAMPLCIAVSGGPDSLALLLLAHAAFPGAVTAATVDHGLRPEAAAEARAVAAICATLGLPHQILTGAWPASGSTQERARALRYRLLGKWAAGQGAGWIATGHHLDDQAETFIMRAARGAGTAGLSGVRARVEMDGVPVPLIRPLLGWRRAELAALVAAAGIAPVDDPSNRDSAYDRTAFRALLAGTPRLRPEGLARAAANLAEAEAALDWAAANCAVERLHALGDTLRLRDPHSLPRELRRRLVALAILRVAPAAAPRGDAIDRLLHLLDSGRAGTLAGVAAKPGDDWHFSPAPPRRGGTGR